MSYYFISPKVCAEADHVWIKLNPRVARCEVCGLVWHKDDGGKCDDC